MRTARFYHQTDNDRIQCDLCPHRCVIEDAGAGICGARKVEGNELKAVGYGLISSAGMDPIEKKPLYHFHPGSDIFSIGGWGCNLSCVFCQNWNISQQVITTSRAQTAESLLAKTPSRNCIGIAYTYNEPLIGIEFVEDCARLAHTQGLANVLVTNGFIQPEPAAEILPLIDALNIDIKSMDDAFYRDRCRGSLLPVLSFAEQAMSAGCHVEITNLLIPGLNDDADLIRKLAVWIRDDLSERVPLHISAYHPQYELDTPSTPAETMLKAYEICREELSYVYLGNLRTETGQNTQCPSCMATLIARSGYTTDIRGIADGKCTSCGSIVDIIMESETQGLHLI